MTSAPNDSNGWYTLTLTVKLNDEDEEWFGFEWTNFVDSLPPHLQAQSSEAWVVPAVPKTE